ncbi:MAG: arsenate reductase (glutaredoxin) [Planctomycetes bacterium]|nr:arsenate reductase (glutaredoxin) [Planctomycetota bacterium]
MSVKIYLNPRCSKCRLTMDLLAQNGVEPVVVEYLETPPSAAELGEVFAKLGKPPQQMIRFKEAIAQELGLSADDDRTDDEWCQLISENPALLERPIVVSGDRAVVGRPPENVLDLLP